MSDSPCCFTSFQVPYLEYLEDDLLPYQEENKLKLDDKSLLPIHHKKEDSELDDEIAALNEFHSSLVATNSSIEIIALATSSTIFEGSTSSQGETKTPSQSSPCGNSTHHIQSPSKETTSSDQGS